MIIRPAFQRQGIAQQLLDHGLQLVATHGGGDVFLHSSDEAQRLYQKNGFEPLKRAELFENRWTTAMLRNGVTADATWNSTAAQPSLSA